MLQLILITVVALLVVAPSPLRAAMPAPPNIVILFADDLGYGDLASYGHPYNRTPRLDTLAAEGQRWTDFYVAAPVCSPSRGALLTGKLPVRTGLYGRKINVMFPGDTVGIPTAELTLAEALKAQGYATGMIGKWHLGDAKEAYPTRQGFDYWYGLPYSNDMDWVGEESFEELLALQAQGKTGHLQKTIANRMAKYLDPKIEYWNVPLIRSVNNGQGFTDEVIEKSADQRTLTKRYTSEAVQFIEQNKQQPFLLYVPYSMPHTPIFRSDDFVGKSLGGRYGDVIEELDWSVGQIVDTLQALQLANNTLVIFSSDNGPWLPMQSDAGSAGLLRGGKGTTFEGGMRVPAIFWWPGTIEPGVISDIGSAMDIYTTALALAGAKMSSPSDGYDLSSTLRAKAPGPRNTLAYYRSGELYALRKGHHKLHLITEGAYQSPPKRTELQNPVLYNLRSDPGEQFDISARRPDVVKDLMRAIEQQRGNVIEKEPLFDQRLQSAPSSQ